MRKTFGAIAIVTLIAAGCHPAGRTTGPTTNGPAAPPAPRATVDAGLKAAARQELNSALANTAPTIRLHAIEGLKDSLGTTARREIVAALADPEPAVRFAAAMAAGELRLGEARPALLKLLNDSKLPSEIESHVQIGAIFALHRMGDVRFSSGLEEALRSPKPDVRANAAFALGRLSEPSAVKVLRPLLKDRAADVRIQVAEALWRLGDENGMTYLVAGVLNWYPEYQMVALMALAGPRDPRITQHVRVCLDSDTPDVRLVAARAMGMLGSDEGFNTAVQGATSATARQRYLAALALGAIGRADGQQTLAQLLKDTDADVRVAAATAVLELR